MTEVFNLSLELAVKAGFIREGQLIELGDMLQNSKLRRTAESEITIADLTGVAIQDLQAATVVFEAATNC